MSTEQEKSRGLQKVTTIRLGFTSDIKTAIASGLLAKGEGTPSSRAASDIVDNLIDARKRTADAEGVTEGLVRIWREQRIKKGGKKESDPNMSFLGWRESGMGVEGLQRLVSGGGSS